MALAPGTDAKKLTKPKDAAPSGTHPSVAGKPLPAGPPESALLAVGFSGSIADFNSRLDAVTAAHADRHGTRPSPGIALDVARSTVPVAHFGPMFASTPANRIVARARQALTVHPVEDTTQFDPRRNLLDALNGARTRDDFNRVVDEHGDELHSFIAQGDKRVIAAYQHAQAGGFHTQIRQTQQGAAKVAAFVPKPGTLLSVVERVTGDSVRAAGQIETGLVLGPPLLVKAEIQGAAASVKRRSPHPFLSTNARLGREIAAGVKRDIADPEANAGNLLLDVYGLASLGAGAGARVAAAGRAAAAGEGAAAVGRALVTRTATGTYHLAPGADVPLSSNPLAAAVQRLVLNRRAKGLSLDETAAGPVPLGAAASIIADKAAQIAEGIADPLRQNFSLENKIGRQLRASDRIQRAVRMSEIEPLERATGSAKSTSMVIHRLGPKGWRGLTVGEQKAVQVLTTDDATPLATWRRFHENMLEQGVGDPAAHRAHLAALEQASKVIAKPSQKFVAALHAVNEVMDEQTRLRIEKLGLSPVSAEERVARLGTVLRGESDLAAATDTALSERLAEIDGRYNKLLDELAAAEGKPGDYRSVTARQNAANAKSVARGRGLVYKPVSQQLRGIAEKKLLQVLESRADDPMVARFVSELADAERIRTELQARSDKAVGLEEGVPLAEARPKNPNAVYLLYQSLAKRRRSPRTFFAPRPGAFGIPHPDGIPETSHYFTGDAIRAGTFRIDATRVAAETYARTVSAAMKLDAWKRLHDHFATDEPRTPDDIPIRAEGAIDKDLRALIAKADSGQVLAAEDLAGLPSQLVDDLTRYLIPHPDEAVSEKGKWKWVDPRYLASEPRSSLPTPLLRAFSSVNEPLRDATLFLRPGYLLNVVGNAGMALIDEGVFFPPNLVRAMNADAKTGRFLDALAGEGRMLSYAPNVGGLTRFSHALASKWNRITDLYFRRAAVIHYLRKAGYKTGEQIAAVRDAYLRGDEDAVRAVTEASQRAKKSMVELDNLAPFEKNVLRHIVFVYPWVSRSAVWSLKALVDHPAQAAIFSEIAQEEGEELDPILKHLPGWARDLGYIPVGWNKDGSPKVINPGSVNTFSTLGEAAGVARGDQVFTDLLGPGAELVVRLATERDRFGRAYKHPYLDPALDTLGGLPQLATIKRAGKREPAETPLDIRNPEALVQREHQDVHRPVFVPTGFWNVYGPLIASGMDPRDLDPRAIDARWWQTQPWERRHQHEAKLVQTMATRQGAFIGRKVPADVRDALTLASLRTAAYHAYSDEKGRTPTKLERTQLDIATLESEGRLTAEKADKLRANLGKVGPDDLDTFRTGVLDRFAGGKQLSDWHRQVSLVARVANRQQLDADVQKLIAGKILPGRWKNTADADGEALVAYGRRYLAYDAKVRDFARREKEARAKGAPTGGIADALREYQDRHDEPVTIGGHTFPPVPRLAVAQLSPDQLQAHLAANYSHPLATLTALDKEMMGLDSSADITHAWAVLRSTIAAWRKEDPTRTFNGPYYARYAAKALDESYKLDGKFTAEVNLSLKPRWQQIRAENIYTESPHRSEWDAVLKVARTFTGYLADPDVDHTATRALWKTWIRDTLVPYLKSRPAFWAELQPYLKADPSFLESLIRR